MSMNIGVVCTQQWQELAALIAAVESGEIAAEIKIVIADRDSDALTLARSSGLYGAFVPRAAFHANRDGYERRLVEIMREMDVEVVVLAGFERETGDVLTEAFPGKVIGLGLEADALVAEVARCVRGGLFSLVP